MQPMSIHTDNRGAAKTAIIFAVAIVVIVAAVFLINRPPVSDTRVSSSKNGTDEMLKKDTINTNADNDGNETMEEKKTEQEMMQKGTNDAEPMVKSESIGYVVYTPEAYAAASTKKRILFFHATWCPTCKAANQDLTANTSRIPSDVIIFKTNYDTEIALKAKYGVTYQHTFVQVDATGNAIIKWNGGSLDEILKKIK